MREFLELAKDWVIHVIMLVVVVAVYFNIGWAIGTYYYYHIFAHEPQTFWQTVWSGGYGLLANDFRFESLPFAQIAFMFFWPTVVGLLVPISWAVYAIHHLVMLAIHSIVFVLWLMGAGGIAKLLGVG